MGFGQDSSLKFPAEWPWDTCCRGLWGETHMATIFSLRALLFSENYNSQEVTWSLGVWVYKLTSGLNSVSVYHVHATPTEAWRGHHITWNWSYRCLWVATWLLGLEPRSSAKTANGFNHRAISPVSIRLKRPPKLSPQKRYPQFHTPPAALLVLIDT